MTPSPDFNSCDSQITQVSKNQPPADSDQPRLIKAQFAAIARVFANGSTKDSKPSDFVVSPGFSISEVAKQARPYEV